MQVRKAAIASLAAAAAVVVPVAVAAPAHAVSTSGCTATPLTPIYSHHNQQGVKVLNYRVTLTCSANRTATVHQERYEEDDWPNGDDFLGTTTFTTAFGATGFTTTLNNFRTLVNGEWGNEEVYQRVRLRVSSNGVTSPWTGWHTSGTLSISD